MEHREEEEYDGRMETKEWLVMIIQVGTLFSILFVSSIVVWIVKYHDYMSVRDYIESILTALGTPLMVVLAWIKYNKIKNKD